MFSFFKKNIKRILQRFSSLREGRRGTAFNLSSDASGLMVSWLTLENEVRKFETAWQDIISIYAYKRDCFAVDLICLAIEKSDRTAIELNEEMNGWKELIESLPVFLPGCKPQEEWWRQVAFPAFELNATEIYKRNCVAQP